MRRRLALAAALLLSCATPPRAWHPPDSAYGKALEDVTRSTTIYKGIDAQLFVYGTHETQAFQDARREHLAEELHVPLGEADARGGELTRPTEGPTFLLAVNATDRSWNDLEQPTTRWVLSLESGEASVRPVSVRRLDSRTPFLRELYPYVDPFFTAYRVVFPPVPPGGPVSLVVAGPLGQGRLTF